MSTQTSTRKREEQEQPEAMQEHGVLHLPAVHMPHVPGVHVPAVSMPHGTAGRVLWWGGLATVAAFGVVDWPVAALVAAGTWVAEQHAKESRSAAQQQSQEAEQPGSRRRATKS